LVQFNVVHEDEHLIVVDKPAGLVVHPARGHRTGTLVNGLLARPGFAPEGDPRDPQGALRPGIVHRLDRGTSGLLVVAKKPLAREGLKAQIAAHTVERAYLAIVVGMPTSATLRSLHGRDPRSRLRFTTRVRQGRRAVTTLDPLESLVGGLAAFVRCLLQTGRTHQIRVHLAEHTGTPVLGDPLYGGIPRSDVLREVARDLGRQALHAAVLGFAHPVTGERLRFESELPDDMARALARLRGQHEPT
jgi:23S rRNA pseudouridine1911/1915/1917 synthase